VAPWEQSNVAQQQGKEVVDRVHREARAPVLREREERPIRERRNVRGRGESWVGDGGTRSRRRAVARYERERSRSGGVMHASRERLGVGFKWMES